MEQTDISVSINGREHSKWRTVSLESSDPVAITKILSRKIPGENEGVDLESHLLSIAGEPRGYPKFVMDILSSI